jgi:hypothetical protein
MPLNAAQIKLHWAGNRSHDGFWRVCAVNHWRMVGGRLDAEARRDGPGDWHSKVWACAEAIARANHTAVTPDDLRKGTYMLALGAAKSLTKFDNTDLDRVLVMFRLLVEPEDLRTVKDWLAYEVFDRARAEIDRCKRQGVTCNVTLPDDPGERRRHLYFIYQSPEAVVAHFVKTRFRGVEPEDMCLRDLRDFSKTLKTRRDYNDREARPRPNVAKPAPQLEEVDQPF